MLMLVLGLFIQELTTTSKEEKKIENNQQIKY